jgi:hypothetical protein
MRHIIFALIVLSFEMAATKPARAQSNAMLVPSVAIGTTYDDNLFARSNGDAGTMTVVRPSIEANYESPKLTTLSLFSFDMQHSNFPALSTLDARRHANIDVKNSTTRKLTLAIGARYDRTETPGELNLDTGVLGVRQVADRWEVVPSMLYRTTLRTAINASYNGMTETLVGDIRGVLHVGRAGVTHKTTEHEEIGLSYLGRRFVDRLAQYQSNAVLAAWSRDVSSIMRFNLQAGPRVSSYRGTNAEVVAGFTRYTDSSRLAMDYWHGETMILGIHGPVAVDTATAKLVWPVTPRSEVGFQSGVTDSTTLQSERIRVYRAVVLGNWTPHGGAYTFSASYGAEFQQGLIVQSLYLNDHVMRHTVRVGVTIAPHLSHTFRPTGEVPGVHPQGDSR